MKVVKPKNDQVSSLIFLQSPGHVMNESRPFRMNRPLRKSVLTRSVTHILNSPPYCLSL